MKICNTLILKKIVIALSILCYLMACVFTPFYYFGMADDDYFLGSIFCLLFGWAGILFHEGFLKIYFLAWYSNITYVFAIRCLIKNQYKRFLTWSFVTIGLGFMFAFCPEIIIDEAGHTQIITMAAGYYLWVTSFLILFVGGIFPHLFEHNRKKGRNLIKNEHHRNRFCRVCGYKLKFSPWGEDNDTPTYEICPCCGAEFGCDDYNLESIKAYREKWIKAGAKWFNPKMMPDNWNLEKQLHNMKSVKSDYNIPPQVPIKDFFHDCNVTHIDIPSTEIKQLWIDAYERGKQDGFCPILLAVDRCFYDSLDDNSEWSNEAKRREWQSKVLNSNFNNATAIIHERTEQVKGRYDDAEWEKDVVGVDEHIEPINNFEIEEGTELYLVEIPVKEPWQVFAYIPIGNWNECPKAEDHMAIAKYWYEKYGACIAYISNDVIEYYLSSPVTGDTMSIAEEHLGYSEDILQGNNLTSLASQLKKSSIWYFWWD